MRSNLLQTGIFIAILILTVIVAYLVNRFFTRLIRRSTEDMKNDPTNYQFLKHFSSGIIYIIGLSIAIYTVPSLRTLASSMLAGAGILAVAVGFASQQALSNIISGVFIIIFKPFRVNDRLKVREFNGMVEDITLRHTVIRDLENKRILIPNAVLSDEIIVNSDFLEDKICKWIVMEVSYDSDIDLAKKIMAEEVEKHPFHMDSRKPEQIDEGVPPVIVRVIQLGNFSIQIRAWAWAKDVADAFVLGCDLNESIKKRFDAVGIEIPYPHQKIIIQEPMKDKM